MKVLLTGGLGYIGSHLATVLSQSEYEVIIIDNLSNSNINTIDKIRNLVKKKNNVFKL